MPRSKKTKRREGRSKAIIDYDVSLASPEIKDVLDKRLTCSSQVTTIVERAGSIQVQVEADSGHMDLMEAFRLADNICYGLYGVCVDGVQFGTLCKDFVIKSIRPIDDDGAAAT